MSKYNYFNQLTVDNSAFPESAQADFGFHSSGFILLNRGLGTIQYSFDGSTIHGDLNGNDSSAGIGYDGRTENKIWFRVSPVSSGSHEVRIEAWGM